MLGREPTEVERLVRLVLATYGRLEALVIGRPAADLDRSLADGPSAIGILTEASRRRGDRRERPGRQPRACDRHRLAVA